MPATKTHAAPQSPQLGQRKTQQRDAIHHIIVSAAGPLTVNQIHDLAQREMKPRSVGIATVYRTLNLLQEKKMIRAVVLPSGETRYEGSHLDIHHHHFQCRKCGNVYDLHVCPVHIPANTVIAGGFKVESHELTLFGLCGPCQHPKRPNRAKSAK